MYKTTIIRPVFFLLVIWCLLGCKNSNKKQSTFAQDSFKEHFIGFVHGTLLLPTEYEQLSKEKLKYIFEEQEDTIKSPSSFLQHIIAVSESDRVDYVVFVNENDLEDIVLVRKSEHINFSKQDANQYVGMLEMAVRDSWGSAPYARLQKKMTRTERAKYIKIKYKIDFDVSISLYYTQYVVTSKVSTFDVIEFRDSPMDFEDLLKRTKYRM